MTVYDREVLDAIRYIGKELREIRKQIEAAPRPLTTRDLPDLETYFERLEDDQK